MSAEAPTASQATYWTDALLAALDDSLLHIENLRIAFLLDDPCSALTTIMRYQSSSAKALCAMQALEAATDHKQVHAREALKHLHRLARVPLALAWALVSQLPHTPI